MTAELRPLQKAEYNREHQALMLTWMFRGVEDRVQVPNTFVRNATNSQRLLVHASTLGIPDQLSEAAYVQTGGHLCFTVPGYPRTVFSQRIIGPDEPEPHEALRTLTSTFPPSNLQNLLHTVLDAEVVALCASQDTLFVLTRERGRIPETSTLRLHRLVPDPDFGVRRPVTTDVCPLAFPGGRPPTGPVRIAVSVLPGVETLFLATSDGGGYTAPVEPGREVALVRMPDEGWPSDSAGLPALHAPRMSAALGGDTVLVVVDGERGELHRVRGVHGPLHAETLPDTHRLPRAAAVDGWSYNVHQHVSEAWPRDLDVSFLVAASPSAGQLWTVALHGPRTALPLIGGGKNPFWPGKVPANLLDVDIGPVNRVVVVPHAGILFGTSGISGWLFLLSPAMLGLLDPDAIRREAVNARTGGEASS